MINIVIFYSAQSLYTNLLFFFSFYYQVSAKQGGQAKAKPGIADSRLSHLIQSIYIYISPN